MDYNCLFLEGGLEVTKLSEVVTCQAPSWIVIAAGIGWQAALSGRQASFLIYIAITHSSMALGEEDTTLIVQMSCPRS